MLGSVLQCCLHYVDFSRIVPGVLEVFSFFSDNSLRGLFATKSATNITLFFLENVIAVLSGKV